MSLKLRRTGNDINSVERKGINDNWDKIESNFNNVVEVVGQAAFDLVVAEGKLIWKEPVDTFADLTTTYPSPEEGWTSMARDTGVIYRYNSAAEWQPIQQITAGPVNALEQEMNDKISQIALLAKDYANLQDALNAANGKTLILEDGKVYEYATLTFPDSIHLKTSNHNPAVLKHADNTDSDFIVLPQNSEYVIMENLVINGNKENQTTYHNAIVSYCDKNVFLNCSFVKTRTAAIRCQAIDYLLVDRCSFVDMEEHQGITINVGSTKAIEVSNQGEVVVTNSYFHADAPSTPGASPGGVIVSGTQIPCTFHNNTFDGIGQYVVNNFIGSVDLYTNGNKSIVTNNRFTNYRYTPLKLQNSGEVICEGNIVENCADANGQQAIIYQPQVRSFATKVRNAVIANNIIKNTMTFPGISIVGSSSNATLLAEGVVIDGNVLENVGLGVNLNYTGSDILITNNVMKSISSDAIRIQNASGNVDIFNNVISNTNLGIYARLNVPNLNVNIKNNRITQYTTQGITVRDANSASVVGNIINTTVAADRMCDLHRLSQVVLKNNETFISSPNIDTSSIPNLFNSGNTWNQRIEFGTIIPTSGVRKRGDVVINTNAAIGSPFGWVCITAGTPGVWGKISEISSL